MAQGAFQELIWQKKYKSGFRLPAAARTQTFGAKQVNMNFSQLHHQATPLLLANVWDVPSAQAAESANFTALGTSSAAMAAVLGYEDGQQIPLEEMLLLIRRIVQNTRLPLSVDLEAGYGETPHQIAANINLLTKIGIAGINIEDSIVVKGTRTLQPAQDFAQTLRQVKSLLSDHCFINVRTDTFLLNTNNPLSETIDRIGRYGAAGADGIFVPTVVKANDISAIVVATKLPINVMCMPELPPFEQLQKLGVRRISMGNFPQQKQQKQLAHLFSDLRTAGNFNPIFQS